MHAGPDQRTLYRRGTKKAPFIVNGQPIHNEYVVPTNPTLLRALRCHVKVKVYQPLLGVKYLFNYFNKRDQGENIQIRHDAHGELGIAVMDEVPNCEAHNSIYCYEADFRIRGFQLNSCSHNVKRLLVHLPSEHMILFVGGEDDALRMAEEWWFNLNRFDQAARGYKYNKIPYLCVE